MYNFNDVRKNENKGFSLVELIVVIAIMAVMTSVLAPALLQYVERSRAQKDDSAMGELTNAIMLALSDQDIYDEVLCYACTNNVSCYIDTAEVPEGVKKVPTKGPQDKPEAWEYDGNQRRNDEVAYYAAGKMRGVTITFYPDRSTNTSQFTLANGQINAFARPNGKEATGGTIQCVAAEKPSSMNYYAGEPEYATRGTLATMCAGSNTDNHFLYNRVRSVIGDKIEMTSQTYRNSDYTVFIRIGSTGGNQASAQDAIKVYGQWNGTNLMASAATTQQGTTQQGGGSGD